VRDNTESEAVDLSRAPDLLRRAGTGIVEQLAELTDLRGKNQNVIEYMMRKVKSEKDEFERGLQRYYAGARSVFSQLTNNLYSHLGMDALRDPTRRTRETDAGGRLHEEPARRDEELLPPRARQSATSRPARSPKSPR
jgi:uncharacterized membrane-anchored protein YhcB (DUF1043 family)